MDEADRKKIYTLLSKFYPNAKQLQDRATLTAWGFVLEKFTYDDVKAAVLDYAARNKYFPDLSDITGSLTPERGDVPDLPDGRDNPPGEIEQKCRESALEWQAEWHAQLHAMGLPTFREATQAGMSPGAWLRLLQEKGAWTT